MYKLLSSKEVYNGFIRLVEDRLEHNNIEITRINAITPEASAIIVTDEDKNIYLVKQLRYAVKKDLLEIPAGIIDKGETAKDAAIREAEEELGYTVKDVKYVLEFYAMPGLSDHIVYIFEGKIDKKSKQNLDDGEFVEVVKVSINDFFNMDIKDAKTLIAKQYLKNRYCK